MGPKCIIFLSYVITFIENQTGSKPLGLNICYIILSFLKVILYSLLNMCQFLLYGCSS